MLKITGRIKKKYKPVTTSIGFHGSEVHRFILEVDDNFIAKGLNNLYHESVFKEVLFHYENFEPGEACDIDNISNGDIVEVEFSIGNFAMKTQPNRKDKSAYILWVDSINEIL